MKSLNKFFIALGLVASLGMTSCVDDLDNPVIDPNDMTPEVFAENPKGYMDRVLAECYQSLATSGYNGPGSS
ncbi:MAG: RagB/SusD family nutrient uptake outer membrane protein, partial [Muribaculaceae bacterium]|nr:RagB/SusD family nutrient uptake outer membrane protein [Muribaculaceae bacterium]